MKCPYCGSENGRVSSTVSKRLVRRQFSQAVADALEDRPDYRLRKRLCLDCWQRFVTIEEVFQLDEFMEKEK